MASLFEMEDFLKNILEAKAKNKMAYDEQTNKALMDRLKVSQAGDTERLWRTNLTAKDIADRTETGQTRRTKLQEAGSLQRKNLDYLTSIFSTLQNTGSSERIAALQETGQTRRTRLQESGATTRTKLTELGLNTRNTTKQQALMDRLKAKFDFEKPLRNENILSSAADRERKAFDLFVDQSRKPLEDKALQIGVSETERMAASNRTADYTKRIQDLFQRMPLEMNQIPEQINQVKAPGTLLQPNGRRKVPKNKAVDLFDFYKDANPFIDMSQYLR
jgi:hypothetical protein